MIQTMTAVQRALDQAYDARGVGRAVRDRVWMGGVRPIGYDVRDRRLGINPAEAETVRQIFGRYLMEILNAHCCSTFDGLGPVI